MLVLSASLKVSQACCKSNQIWSLLQPSQLASAGQVQQMLGGAGVRAGERCYGAWGGERVDLWVGQFGKWGGTGLGSQGCILTPTPVWLAPTWAILSYNNNFAAAVLSSPIENAGAYPDATSN